jgi:sulfite reductase alpha subunit-like flavoprotein
MRKTSTPKASPAKYTTAEKVVKLSSPEYVLHTDTELEQVRKHYFELLKTGEQRNCQMSKELRCRLIRNTMTSIISILRAKGDGESHRNPSKPEITAMAKTIVLPLLQDQDLHTWVSQMHPVDDCVSCWTFLVAI